MILGLVGAVLLAIGGFGDGAGAHRYTAWVALPLCAAGVVLLLVGWWRLRSAAAGDVVRAAWLWAVPLLIAPPLFSRDVYAYAGQARLVLVGLDPYTHGPADAPGPLADEVDAVWGHAASPYGPVFLRLAALVARVTGQHPMAAAYGLRLLAVLGV